MSNEFAINDTLIHASEGGIHVVDSADQPLQGQKYFQYTYDVAASELPGNHPLSAPRKLESTSWIAYLLLGLVILYTLIQYRNFEKTGQILRAFVSKTQARQLLKEGSLNNKGLSLLLQFFSIGTLSLFVFEILELLNLNGFLEEGFLGYLEIAGITAALWNIKVIAIQLSGFLLKTERSSQEYNMNMLIYTIITAMILTPIVILSIYVDQKIFVYTGISLWIIVFFLWIIRGLSIGLEERNFSILHLFLYLCTFEILPYIVLAKLILEAN